MKLVIAASSPPPVGNGAKSCTVLRMCIRISVMLALLCAGCASVSKHLVSEPAAKAEGSSITKSGWLQSDGSVIALRPYNTITVGWSECSIFGRTEIREKDAKDYRFYGTYYESKLVSETDFFIVEVLIAPLRNRGIIDFQKILLKTATGQVVKPSGYYELEPRYGTSIPWYDSDQTQSQLCKPKKQPSWSAANPLRMTRVEDTSKKVQLQENQGYCFALKYDVPPPYPTSSFTLDAEGISIGGSTISLPIMYTPVVRTNHHSCAPTL